ncbi:N-methyl-L-tryptophan oxidase [Ruania alba]|uniref:Sarcosine oxidase n=1 Tax=Ruania alba TaxID=648782 RepID=A0A1H5HPI3_9MICO|nr:N-methyl-L-tryptophan oxidase [Ruania alba]SEE29872.1 sarcosine oxidase [Ruania alba]
MNARIAVIGLGTMGSMALWRLAARGAHVEGFEQYGIAHPRGAAGGQTRRFSALSQSEVQNTPLALDALELWRGLESTSGRDLLTLTGGLVIGRPGTPALEQARESLTAHGLDREDLGTKELRHQYPQHGFRDGEEAVRDTVTGYVRPELSVMTAIGAARARGAIVHEYTPVLEVSERHGGGVQVRTHAGTHEFDHAIVAPGAWARRVLPEAAEVVQPRRVVQSWYLPRDVSAYQREVFPVFERVGDVRAYGFPTLDQATVKIGAYLGREHPPVADPDNLDREITTTMVAQLREIVTTFFPGLHPEPVTLSAHQEGYTPDKRWIIGTAPDQPSVITACGFSGSGFKFAPTIGDILADLALDGGTSRDIARFAPDRFVGAR